MTLDKGSEDLAHEAARATEDYFGRRNPSVGIILGTGWGDTLVLKHDRPVFGVSAYQNLRYERRLKELSGFEKVGVLEGHARTIAFGHVGEKEVVAMRGRVHLNEAPCDPNIYRMVRLQVEMLFHLGVKTLILTASVGSLVPEISVGQVVTIDKLLTVFAPEMPLFVGEFNSPEDALKEELHDIAKDACRSDGAQLPFRARTCHSMVRGPFFEGRKVDKAALAMLGAQVVGMSIVPEACIASLYNIPVLALGFVTNTAIEEHKHETNQARAKESAALLGGFLERLITSLP